MDDDEISPRYVEASVKTLLDYPEAVCATPYILAGSCKYFPANHTEDSWFRRIFIQLLLPIISDKAGMTSFSMLFSVTRTSIARKAMREALWRWEALRSHNNATADGHFCFLKLCLGQAVPIADREAVYILHADTGKEYEYIGKHTDTNSFFQNQRDKFWMMSDYVKGYADFVKIVYDRGRWRCALPFGLLILVILLYMAGSSLYQQVRGRWRKILGKEERMRN
jgi:hypothetical protein